MNPAKTLREFLSLVSIMRDSEVICRVEKSSLLAGVISHGWFLRILTIALKSTELFLDYLNYVDRLGKMSRSRTIIIHCPVAR
jgi:hypothetical protein